MKLRSIMETNIFSDRRQYQSLKVLNKIEHAIPHVNTRQKRDRRFKTLLRLLSARSKTLSSVSPLFFALFSCLKHNSETEDSISCTTVLSSSDNSLNKIATKLSTSLCLSSLIKIFFYLYFRFLFL